MRCAKGCNKHSVREGSKTVMTASNARTGITGLTCFLMGLLVGMLTAPKRGADVRRAVRRYALTMTDALLVGIHARPAHWRQENAEDLMV